MFGISLVTLIGYAITYGPQVVKVIQALGPVIQAAEPIVAQLIKKGMSEDAARSKVYGWIAAPHKMTQEETNQWMAMSGIGPQS